MRPFLAILAAWTALAGTAFSQTVTARHRHTATVLSDGNILVVGGVTTAGAAMNSVEIYRSTNATVSTAANLNVARGSHTATLLPDGRVLVTGGCTGAAPCSGIASSGEIYNPQTNAWTTVANSMDAARLNHTASLLPNGKVLIVGGQTSGAGAVTKDCDLFDPATNLFLSGTGQCADLALARAGHTTTLLHTGRVLVAGGYLDSSSPGFAVSTELYDPSINSWSSGPSLIQRRAFHSATQMGHQKVLIVGGVNGRNVQENRGMLQTSEIYDPTSNSITPADPMKVRRAFHTSTLAPDGKVRIFGGLANFTTSYFQTALPFQSGSRLTITPYVAAGSENLGSISATGSTLTLNLGTLQFSTAFNGRIIDGDIAFSSPTASADGAAFHFAWENGSPAALNGTTALTLDGVPMANGVPSGTAVISQFTGAARFTPSQVSVIETPAPIFTSANVTTTPDPVTNSGASTLGGSFAVSNLRLPMPASAIIGVTQFRGKVQIISGSVDGSQAALPFSMSLTGGESAVFTGTVSSGPVGNLELAVSGNVTFSGISGTVTSSTTTAIPAATLNSSGIPGKSLASLSVLMTYTLTPVDMAGQTFSFTIATGTVNLAQSADLEAYDPQANSWSFDTPGSIPLIGATSVLLPNQDELLLGGLACESVSACQARSFTAQDFGGARVYVESGNWSAAPSLTRARSNHSATVLPDGRLLIAGGSNGTEPVRIAEVFLATASRWEDTRPMRLPRSHHSATLLPNGTVLVTGGFTTAASTGATNHAEIFYPQTGSWIPTSPMNSSRSFHSTVVLPDGNVLVAGGFAEGTFLDSAEIYFSTSRRWVPIESMDTERAQHSVALLSNGRVLVSGGTNAGGVLGSGTAASQSPGTVGSEIYNPATGSWARVTSGMSTPRHSHTSTILADGRVVVLGGNDGFGEIGDAEIFNPVSGAWSRTQEDLGGNDLLSPRLGHAVQLLPTNKLLVTGGFTALGGGISKAEGFDVAFTTWQSQGAFASARGDHTVSLLFDGSLIAVGGTIGAEAASSVEKQDFGATPDQATPSSGFSRRPEIDSTDSTRYLPGSRVTLKGANFKGRTEASGGGSGSGNSSFHHPRILVQTLSGSAGSASNNDSSRLLDLSSSAYFSGFNSWSTMDSSITFALPTTTNELPYGWYEVRVAANGQYSDSKIIQVAPVPPSSAPGIPVGTRLGVSSVSWTWTAASGSIDGYNVYSATDGVFLGTVAVSGGATDSFIHTNLGPDTSSQLRISAFNLGGDGPVSIASIPVVTPGSSVLNLTGSPESSTSIFWSWTSVTDALYYSVMVSSNLSVIGTPASPNFTQTGLSTNTAYSIRVRAVLGTGTGILTDPTTVYTLAVSPAPGIPPVLSVSTGGFIARWLGNGNPAGTNYRFRYTSDISTTTVSNPVTTALDSTVTNSKPNIGYALEVEALNGNGVSSGFISLGSTATLASPPANPTITFSDPSSIRLTWSANGNHDATRYQVLYSSDNFTTHFGTHTVFSDALVLTTTTVTGLVTSQSYSFRISAYNKFGIESAQVSTASVTDNGGGPAGSLSALVQAQELTLLDGTLGSGRRFTMRVPPGSFERETRIFVSSTASLNCGSINGAITITPVPATQPIYPFEASLQYVPGEANLGNLSTLVLARYDEASGTCVPLPTTVNEGSNLVTAQINHLSTFQLMQLAPQSSLSGGRVFPNPLYKSRQGFFTFDRLPAGARIRVFTLHGGEVFDGSTNASGLTTWDATNQSGRPVASGVYIAVVESGGEKETFKLAVIR